MNLTTVNLTNVSDISQTCSVDGIFGEFPLGVFAKITTVLTFFLNRLGSILFLGLVHYEKFGQDSQKRHVTDRIFSFNALLFIFCYLIRDIIITVRIFAGVLGNAMGLLGAQSRTSNRKTWFHYPASLVRRFWGNVTKVFVHELFGYVTRSLWLRFPSAN